MVVYATSRICSQSFRDYFPEMKIINTLQDLKIAKESADLIIFTGGEDINPELYGQENLYSYGINPMRDQKERLIFKEMLKSNKKMFGSCRGHQLINVLLGGLLVQDIIFQLGFNHGSFHGLNTIDSRIINYPFIPIIPQIFKKVNSIHHQGVVIPGNGLYPTTKFGGVIESCESKNIITTQFHPEFMRGTQASQFFDYLKEWIR